MEITYGNRDPAIVKLTEPFTAEYHDAVMFGDRPCPWCNGTGWLAPPISLRVQVPKIGWKKRIVENSALPLPP